MYLVTKLLAQTIWLKPQAAEYSFTVLWMSVPTTPFYFYLRIC